MEKPQTWFASLVCKKHTEPPSYRCVFFIVYLLKIITNIIKANTIIVSTTKPNKSKININGLNKIYKKELILKVLHIYNIEEYGDIAKRLRHESAKF